MEKNIAALLRNDTRTIRVAFEPTVQEKDLEHFQGQKLYSYVTHLQLVPGDSVVVEAAGNLKVVTVVHVDDDVKVEPQATYELRWVVCKVDFGDYEANKHKNEEIERTVVEAYRANLRRSFAQQILSGVSDTDRVRLENLLK